MPRVAGLSVDAQEMSLALVEGSGKNWKLIRTVRCRRRIEVAEPLPEPPAEDAEASAEAPAPAAPEAATDGELTALLREAGASGAPVLSCLSSDHVILRRLQVPFTAEEHIRRTVPFEVEQQIHHVGIDDLVVDFKVVRSMEGSSHLLVAAAPTDVVRQHLDFLALANVDPVTLGLDLSACFGGLVAAGAFADHPDAVVCHVAPTHALLLVVEDGKWVGARTLAAAFDAEGEGAMPADVYARMLSRAIGAMITAYPLEKEQQTILLTGTRDRVAVLTELLERHTGWAVRLCEPPPPEVAGGVETRVFDPVPLGLALEGVGMAPAGLDFRRGDFRYRRKFDAVKQALLSMACLWLMLFGLLAFHFYLERDTAAAQLADLKGRQQDIFRAAFPDEDMPAAGEIAARIQTLRTREEVLMGKGDSPLAASALHYWRGIANAFAPYRTAGTVSMSSVSVDLSRERMEARVSGRAPDRRTVEDILRRIKQEDGLAGAQYSGGTQVDPQTGEIRFAFRIPIPEKP